MALYAQHLALGNTIHGTLVKRDTIDGYTRHVAQHLINHFRQLIVDDAKILLDPRITSQHTGLCYELQKILEEIARWENRPRKANPFTKEMLNFLCKQAQKESNPNSLTASLADWLTLALYTSLRLSEYCQYSTHTNRGTIAYNMDNEPKAFLAQDFRFFVANEHTISATQAIILSPFNISKIEITWRRQKNSEVDQTRNLVRDDNHPERCPIRSILRIFVRAKDHHIPPLHPLCIYTVVDCHLTSTVKLINDLEIREKMKNLASIVHKVNDPLDLAKYSTHSARVGACVLLFLAHMPKDIIQYCLRWKSDSWKEYLRHLPAMAQQQVSAINSTTTYSNVKDSGCIPPLPT